MLEGPSDDETGVPPPRPSSPIMPTAAIDKIMVPAVAIWIVLNQRMPRRFVMTKMSTRATEKPRAASSPRRGRGR